MGKFILSNDAKRLLRRVRNAILKNPETYNQKNWCGTDCCIAGHIVMLGIKDGDIDEVDHINGDVYKNGKTIGNTREYARKKLGLTPTLANKLFLIPGCSDMPKNSGWNLFSGEYAESMREIIFCQNHKPHAKMGAKRIDYFIEHNR